MLKFFRLIFILFIILFSSCQFSTENKKVIKHKDLLSVYSRLSTINILPLGHVDAGVIDQVKDALTDFYKRDVVVLKPVGFSGTLKRTQSSRLSADSILKYYSSDVQTILVTSSDITLYDSNKKADWGIFGKAMKPGKISVISVYKGRLGKSVSSTKLHSRARKVAIHEVGHNLGLNHCIKDLTCVMHAGDGKASQVDKELEGFCDNCKRLLISKLSFF
jgi:archaemetzincin